MKSYSKQELQTIITEAAQRHGVNANHLKIIAGIESSYRPNAVGKNTKYGQAKGLFQFIPPTAKAYGLTDPLDPVASADAAARYWKDLNVRYKGDVRAMIAQYNGGNAGARAVSEGKVFEETSGYFNKWNKEANKQGLADLIDTQGLTVVGAKAKKGATVVPEQQPEQPAVKLNSAFVGDVRSFEGQDRTQQYTELAQREYADNQQGFLDSAADFGNAAGAGFAVGNLTYQAGQYALQKVPVAPEEDARWAETATNDYLRARLEEAKVPQEQWEYVLDGSESRQSFENRMQRVEQARKEQETMSKSIGGTITGIIAGSITDPMFWLSGGAGAAVSSMVAAGKVARTASAVAAGAALDASLTAAVGGKVDPRQETMDVVINGIGGGVAGWLGKIAKGDAAARLDDVPIKGVPADAPPPSVFDEPIPDTPPVRNPEPTPEPAPEEPPVELPEGFEPPPPSATPEVKPEAAPEAPKPVKAEWDAEWDEPVYASTERVKGQAGFDTIVIPPKLSVEGAYSYIAKHGTANEKVLADKLREATKGLAQVVAWLDPNKGGMSQLAKVTSSEAGRKFIKDKDALAEIKLRTKSQAADVSGTKGWVTMGYAARNLSETSQGAYRAVAYRISRYSSGEGKSRLGVTGATFLHEQLHVVTSLLRMHSDASGNMLKTADEIAAIYNVSPDVAKAAMDSRESLNELYKAIQADDLDVSGVYGMKTLDEFIAEFSNLSFVRWMANATKDKPALRSLLETATKFAARLVEGFVGKKLSKEPIVQTYGERLLKVIDDNSRLIRDAVRNSKGKPSKLDARTMTDEEAVDALVRGNDGKVTFGKTAGGFALENILQNPSMPAGVRDLAAKLFGSTAGYRNGAVVERNAWDRTVQLRNATMTQFRKKVQPEFNKWLERQRAAGSYRGWSPATKEKALTDFYESVYDEVAGYARSTDPEITAAAEATRGWFADWVDRINNPMGDEGGVSRGITQREVIDPETGEVTLVGELPKDRNYVPFKISTAKLNEVVARFGLKEVEKLLEEAFYRARPDLEEIAKEGGKAYGAMFGRWYLKQIQDSRINRKFDYLHSLETSASGDELIQSMVNGGVSLEDATKIVEGLLEKNKGSKAFNSALRHRSTFDRTYTKVMEDGSELSVRDLIDRDLGKLVEGYSNRMSGAVSLAKTFEGASSFEDVNKLIQQTLTRELGEQALSTQQVNEAKKAFESAMAHILSRPLDEPSNVKLGLSLLRDHNVATRLGGAVMYQLAELSQLVGTLGLKNVLRAVPELRGSFFRAKNGKLLNEELDAYEELIGGAGNEMLNHLDIRAGDEWATLNEGKSWATKADAAAFYGKKAAAGVLKYTGMTGLMVIEKRLALIAITRHFQDALIGGKKLQYSAKRLAWMGLDEPSVAQLGEAFKKYTKKSPRGRDQLDVRRFASEDPDTFAKWATALQRESRRVIQENDLGSHIPAMDNGWFKSFAQFRTFVLQAYNKAFLYGINHADAQSAATLMYGVFFAALIQTARTQLKAAGLEGEERREYLEKYGKLTGAGGILARSVASVSQASILPQVFDTISPFGSLFDGYRNSTDASSLWANPTADTVNALFNTAKQGAYMVTGQDTLDKRDFQQAAKLLPFNNAIGVSNALSVMGSALPANTKAELLFDDEEE